MLVNLRHLKLTGKFWESLFLSFANLTNFILIVRGGGSGMIYPISIVSLPLVALDYPPASLCRPYKSSKIIQLGTLAGCFKH